MGSGHAHLARVWRAYETSAGRYAAHFEASVLPELAAVEEFLGAQLLQRSGDQAIEILVLTRWASRDAIAAFAGEDPDQAVVEAEAIAVLEDYDREVVHYEVVHAENVQQAT